jgi:hypothetical protein
MIARVFPRKTKASPNDALVFFGPPSMFLPKIEEIHVSVAFTWDIPKAEILARQWEQIAPVKIGGPAFGEPGNGFVPGRYLKPGYTITSRGCPNRCWFCSVWKREPKLIELPIMDGWNMLDDNLLACAESHIRAVFSMLKRQPHKAEFTGGLEAKIIKPWHIDLLVDLKPSQFFCAYDTADDYEPLVYASKMFLEAGFTRHQMRCYVLIGYQGDTFDKAEYRLRQTLELGFFPMAMLYRDNTGKRDIQWMRFQKPWARPAAIAAMAQG